ncbi:MAG: hypothetical protein EOO24_05185 [Comamonadaceae bacterium]|nr:MAG: hypothetical protein EOO24_05185 [Comamonadaceae bacterium]
MERLFTLANLVDAVIAFTLLEGVVLVLHHRRTGAGVAPREFLANLISGASLMLALHGAVRDLGAVWVVLWLSLAGMAHAWDLRRRWVRLADRS